MNILTSFDNYIESMKPHFQGNWDQFVGSKQQIKVELSELGWPKRKEESWKNSSLKFLNDYNFKQESLNSETLTEKLLTEVRKLLLENHYHVVVINGTYMSTLSYLGEPNSSAVLINNSFDFITQEEASAQDYQENKSSFTFSKPFALLNDLFRYQKLELKITKNSHLNLPIQILHYVYSPTEQSLNSNPHLEIILEESAKASIILSYQGPQGIKYFNNARLKTRIMENAHLEFINETKESYQAFHLDQNQFDIEKNASLKYLDFNLMAQWARHELVVNLKDEGASAQICGATYLKYNEHCDHQTKIHFKASHTTSEQLYKSILDDEARAVFSGTVFIDPNLEQANSSQLNNNLILSDKAEANSKPVLMIYSDDVKASHGSTVGQLNPEEMFYLQTRCLTKERAKELLSIGFLLELIERFSEAEVRRYLEAGLKQKFLSLLDRPTIRNLK